MKKRVRLFVLVAFALLFIQIFSFYVSAQSAAEQETNDAVKGVIGVDPDKIPDDVDDLEQIKADYLKKEWGKILKSKPIIGPIIVFIDGVLTDLNPFFRVVIGYEYSFSWAFIFGICIWLALFFLMFPPVSVIAKQTWVGVILSIAVVSLIGQTGVIKKAVDMLVFVIKNAWIAWLSFAIAIILVALFAKFGKGLKETIAKHMEEAAKAETARDRKLIKTEAGIAKNQLDSFTDN